MKKILQKLLPKKIHFMAVDVGAREIKAAEAKVVDGVPEVISLKRRPSPPGVWTEELDEEKLVEALKEIANPRLKEVITCIGGEKVISRVVRLPQMSGKELEGAVRYEVARFVPTPVDQLIIRSVWLDEGTEQEEGRNVLLLAVPAATVYRYYGIFSRAGLTITAIDLQAFALWRLFGRQVTGTVAIVDIGAQTSHLVVVRNGIIRFVRLLPMGGNVLTRFLADTYGVELAEAEQMKLEAAAAGKNGSVAPGVVQVSDVVQGGMVEVSRELKRSLEFCAAQEKVQVEKVILSGGTSKLTGLPAHLQETLGVPAEIGLPEIALPEGEAYDPVFAVAIGLALREVT